MCFLKSDYLNSGEDCSPVLKHFLEHSTYHHIFIDEIPPFRKDMKKNDFFSLEKKYCVTMKCDVFSNTVNEEWIKQMKERYNAKRIHLKHNLRNSETILNIAEFFDKITYKIYINKARVKQGYNMLGPKCYHYHNIHKLDQGMLVRAAILKYFKHKPQKSIVVLHEFSYSETENIYNNLQKYFSTDRNVVYLPSSIHDADYEKHIREVKEYLEKPEGILVTDIHSFSGAQAKNIIIIGDSFMFLRDMIMRTMSFAIIIHEEDIFKESVPGLVRDENLHEYIHPGNTEQLVCNNDEDLHRSNCDWP